MDPDALSLLVLLSVLAVAAFKETWVGPIAIVSALLLSSEFLPLAPREVAGIFPSALFVTLSGVMFFFGIVKSTGVLDHAVEWAVSAAKGRTRFLPLMFFLAAMLLAAVGAGNIIAVAVLAPLAMSLAKRSGVSRFFMTLMLVNGANAGTFSPFSPTGVIAMRSTASFGLAMEPWTQMFLPSFIAQSFIAAVWYALLAPSVPSVQVAAIPPKPFDQPQRLALTAIVFFLISVIGLRWDLGLVALSLSAILLVFGAARSWSPKNVPWSIVLMVCGVSFLIGVAEKLGGLLRVTDFLASISDPVTATGILAATAGALSNFSSSSGVVLPSMIPLVPGLIEKMGGGNAAALVASINVGSHVVDVSPFSTLGALCLAAAHGDKDQLFRKLLITGLLMTIFGAAVCYVFFGLGGNVFAR